MKRMLAVFMVCMLAIGTFIIIPGGEGTPDVTRAPGRTLYVAPENSTYTEIGYALIDAVDGDTIFVAPGNYAKGMMIGTNGVTIIGNYTEGEVVVGQLGEGIAGIHAKWVNVSGITFTDDNNHIGIMSMVGAENVSVNDVKLMTSKVSEGLYIRNSKHLTFTNITVRTQDKQSVRIRESQNITFEDFDFSCNTSVGGCFELDTTDEIVLDDGNIEVRSSGTAIYNLAGADLDLFDVDATYTEKFIMMETGYISMYNMDIDPADILMDDPHLVHSVKSYFLRKVQVRGEGPDGQIIPLEGADLNFTVHSMDRGNVYSTSMFGGNDSVSGSDGYFVGEIPFLSWEKIDDGMGIIDGNNTIEIYFLGDKEVKFMDIIVHPNSAEDHVVDLVGLYNQTRTLEGYVSSLTHPVYGEPIVNASINILGDNQTLVGNGTTNETGYFKIENIPLGINHTIVVEPLDPVVEGGKESGYLTFESWVNLTEDDVVTIFLEYYEFVSGPISGYVKYNEGPNDGLFCEGAQVILLNFTGANVGTTTTNASGYYEFSEVPFGIGYEIRITPPLDELGVNQEITGYLFWDGSGFVHNVSTTINALLNYYDHVRPVSAHPKVAIIGEDDEPVEGAQVEVTIEGATYTSRTNMFGIATFEGLDMEEFPDEATFRVSKEGYDDLVWTQGDSIPKFKESEDDKHFWLIIILVLVVMVVIAFAAYMIFFKKGPDDLIEE